METTFKCKCDEICLRPLIVRNYDSDRLEFEIDGNAIVLDFEQLGQLYDILLDYANILSNSSRINHESR